MATMPHNNAPQSKAVTVNNTRKILSCLMCPSWRRCSSTLMRTLFEDDASVVSVCICIVLTCTVYIGQSVNQSLSKHDNKQTEEWANKCSWYYDGNLYFRTDSKGNLTSTRLFWKFFIHAKRSRKTLRRLPCKELHCLNKRYNFIVFLSFLRWKVHFICLVMFFINIRQWCWLGSHFLL